MYEVLTSVKVETVTLWVLKLYSHVGAYHERRNLLPPSMGEKWYKFQLETGESLISAFILGTHKYPFRCRQRV